MAEEISKRAEEITEAKTGNEFAVEKANPIEEAKRLNDDLLKNLAEMRQLKTDMEKAAAYMMLSGKSMANHAPKEKTEEEKIQEEADKLIGRFRK